MMYSNYVINISVIIGSMMAASTKTLQFISVTVLKIIFKHGIPEKLDSGRMVWKLRLWTLGLWIHGLWTLGRLDSGRLDFERLGAWPLDAWNLDNWKLGLWTLARLDLRRLDAWTLNVIDA